MASTLREKAAHARYREKNRDTLRAKARNYARRTADKRRDRNLRNAYGITSADYDRMLDEQNGVCAICGNPPTGRRLAVDHCHETSKVRGLLCGRCNRWLSAGTGWWYEKAMAYLKHYAD